MSLIKRSRLQTDNKMDEQSNKSSFINHFSDAFSESVNRVFDLEELREIILDYVIHDKNETVVDNIRSCRLVNKTWLLSTSAILLKCQEPLFRFELFAGETRYLNALRKALNDARLLDVRVPPFALNIPYDSTLARTKNCQKHLPRLLFDFGNSLTELAISSAQTVMPSSLQNVLLPKLRRFSVHIFTWEPKISLQIWKDKIEKILQTTQSVLDASPHIKSFSVFHRSLQLNANSFTAGMPSTFEKLIRLPVSLTEVSLDFEINANQLDVLLKNPPPKLKRLLVHFEDKSLKDGTVTGILQCFSKTLEQFHITGGEFLRQHYPASFQLPYMEKLKSLKIDTLGYLDLNGDCSSLQQFLPKLEHLTLAQRKLSMLQKWIDQSCFPSVTSLNVSLTYETDNSTLSMGLCTMEKIKRAFPNITKLEIQIGLQSGVESPEFRFITTEMRSLQDLRIFCARNYYISNSDFWDALIIGIPVERVARLKWKPGLWKELEASSTESLRNLTELHTLELGNGYVVHKDAVLISDASFRFTFLKMPNLKTRIFKDNFRVSRLMREKWTNEGRAVDSPT